MKITLTPYAQELLYEIVGWLAMATLVGLGVAGTLAWQWGAALLAEWGA